MMRLTTPDIVWILTVEWAGDTYRFATEQSEIDGLPYAGVLVVSDYSESADLFSSDAAPSEARVSALFPVPVARQNAWLRSGTAELSQWLPGLTYSQRIVKVRGSIRNPSYGTVDEPVSFNIQPDGGEDRALRPPADAKTADDVVTANAGYPFVYGKPSHSPALILSESGSDNIVIAGHRVPAGSVRIVKVDEFGAETSSTETIVIDTDASGRVIALATVVGLGSSARVYVDWSESNGGLVPDGGLGDCVIALLEQSTVTWDRAAWEGASDELNAYVVGFYLDSPDSPWAVARMALLSLTPASIRSGPNGVRPVLWQIGGTDAIAHIEQGRNAWREGGLNEDDDQQANSFQINYDITETADHARTATLDRSVSHPCAVSHDNFGTLSAEPIESRAVGALSTAARALSWRSIAYPFPWRTVSYASSDASLASLVVGDLVTVTDSDFSLSDTFAHVVGVEWVAGAILVTCTIIHRP